MIKTVWGENLNKIRPLPEYPRPQFKRDSYINLNGEWELEYCESEEFPQKFGYKITVPFSPETTLSGVEENLKMKNISFIKRNLIFPMVLIKAEFLSTSVPLTK